MIFLNFCARFFIVIALFFLISIYPAKSEVGFVVAKVNNDIITFNDLKDRYNFVISESKIKINSPQEKRLLINQIIDKMIDEELIRQEAKKTNINLSSEEIDGVIESLAQRNKKIKTISELKRYFANKKLSFLAYQNQVRADLIWSQIISNAVRSRIKITDSEIKEFLEQQKLNTSVIKYLIAEIFIPQDADAKLLATKLVDELRRGANFKTIVTQFSRSPSFESGGEIGWVSRFDIDAKIYNAISGLKKNGYSDPVFLSDGYYIFKLLDKKSVTELKENDAAEARQKIFTRELEVESKSYLIDLHKNSFIEVDREKLLKLI